MPHRKSRPICRKLARDFGWIRRTSNLLILVQLIRSKFAWLSIGGVNLLRAVLEPDPIRLTNLIGESVSTLKRRDRFTDLITMQSDRNGL